MPKKKIKIDIIKIKKYPNPKRRCLSCECDEREHERYWACLHFKGGDVCDICCWYDSQAPDWDWKECATCEHDKERDKGFSEEDEIIE